MLLLHPTMYYVMFPTYIESYVAPKSAPSNLCLLVFMPLYNPSPWMWAGPSDLFQTNRIWQKWCFWSYKNTMMSILGTLSCSLACLLWKKPVPCCNLRYEGPYGKELWEASRQQAVSNWGLQSNSPQGVKFCQQPHSELGSGSSPRQAFRWGFNISQHSDCNHMRDLKSEAPR